MGSVLALGGNRVLEKFFVNRFALLRKCLTVVEARDKKKLVTFGIFQFSLSVLDLFGVIVLGALGALSIAGINSREPGDRISKLLFFFKIDGYSFQSQAIILAGLGTFLLISRTFLTVILNRRLLFFLAERSSEISSKLFERFLSSPPHIISRNSPQKALFALSRGVDLLTVQILGTSISLISDIGALVLLSIGLLVIDPIIAIFTLTLFTAAGLALYFYMNVRARRYGQIRTQLEIDINKRFIEAYFTFRELYVHSRQGHYTNIFRGLRKSNSVAIAEVSFMPSISKFVIETLILLGAIVIGILQFALHDAYRAIGTISVFFAAGFRLAPALLRVQQGILNLKTSGGQIEPTLELIDQLQDTSISLAKESELKLNIATSISGVHFAEVDYSYPDNNNFAIQKLNLHFRENQITALVGPSGSGKSTLVDLLLGVLAPDQGSVFLFGKTPAVYIDSEPTSVSYVPQKTSLIEGTLRENVAFGFDRNDFSDSEIWDSLKFANLEVYVKELPDGLDTQIGIDGLSLSGGQQQRLSLARAILTRPKLLVLDEATSNLDAETEDSISKAIHELRGITTVVMIAHRLSSVRNADEVFYLKDGHLIASGDFDSVRSQVPDFDRQANLMGF